VPRLLANSGIVVLQVELSPIENALELIGKRTETIRQGLCASLAFLAILTNSTPTPTPTQQTQNSSTLAPKHSNLCSKALSGCVRNSPASLQLSLNSLCAEVHAGPTEICKTFLSPKEVGKFDQGAVQKLRIALQEFLDACAEALAKNQELIATAQLPFHQELEEGYRQVKEFMEPMLQDPN